MKILVSVLFLILSQVFSAFGLSQRRFRFGNFRSEKSEVYLETAPLIGGPTWLPIHVKVVIESNNHQCHKWDMVPHEASDPKTLLRITTLQDVPADFRYISASTTPSGQEASRMIEAANSFRENYANRYLHLLRNNCWTYAVSLFCYLKDEYADERKW